MGPRKKQGQKLVNKLHALEPQTPDYSVVFGRAAKHDTSPQGGTKGLERLLGYVIEERQKLLDSGYRYAYKTLRVPSNVVSILVDGELFRVPPKGCELWFRRLDSKRGQDISQNYDLSQFCLQEVVDLFGHYHQIHLQVGGDDRSATLLRVKELYVPSRTAVHVSPVVVGSRL